MTSTRRIVSAALAAAAITGVAAPLALAHAGVKSTSPANGATVKALPGFVKITFSEPIGRVTFVKVLDAKGKDHVQTAGLDPKSAARVLAKTINPVAGAYRVQWKIVADDGHAESGTFVFGASGK